MYCRARAYLMKTIKLYNGVSKTKTKIIKFKNIPI